MTPLPLFGFADPLSSWTHLAGALAALFAAYFLYQRGRGNPTRVLALMIFSFALFLLFLMSGTYHSMEHGGLARDVWQRLDHAGIWLFIASTFTPIHVILFRHHLRWAVLLFVWTFAIVALVLDVIYLHTMPPLMLLALFFGLGWVGALTGYMFLRKFAHRSIALFFFGGLAYSVGAVIDFRNDLVLWPGVVGPHEIFHLFVILGAFLHWRFIYFWSNQPVEQNLVFHVTRTSERRLFARAVEDEIVVHGHALQDVKLAIKKEMERRFHSALRPAVILRYQREQHL